ncbi:uncharacterized protein F4812DRAFT_463593 [Daldinia caldariorum]|uniref:uncharacterized protein n=1 Tax=Daldinia caldariorum TaxID=326644 RepID=UPI002008223C|nr:uncharacterized protein F4812DRAFT_463593 [Daldinia caldariorum]KAI1463494.1 hypothetical protein F4812DRAFT_463593 [Daldinia caldariorum]
MRAKGNAQLVNQLIDGGMIILGKGKLTANIQGAFDTPLSWSAYMGQTLSTHRLPNLEDEKQPVSIHINSKDNSAIEAETAGPTVYPASCCDLYGMELTLGSVSIEGVFELSESFDTIGVLARTPTDLALLAKIIIKKEASSETTPYGMASRTLGSWEGLGVDIVPIIGV